MGRSYQWRLLLLGAMLSACASTKFISTWKSPSAAPVEVKGAKVAAVVMTRDDGSRRKAEDLLAREISARGAQGVPMYTILPQATLDDEPAARAALDAAQVEGLIVMRPVGVKTDTVEPLPYTGTVYDGYWGGYYAYGWASPWGMGTTSSDAYSYTTLSVETLVYSLKQNKLLWAGVSETINPSNLEKLMEELGVEINKELNDRGLVVR
jgi:hypothetical protein